MREFPTFSFENVSCPPSDTAYHKSCRSKLAGNVFTLGRASRLGFGMEEVGQCRDEMIGNRRHFLQFRVHFRQIGESFDCSDPGTPIVLGLAQTHLRYKNFKLNKAFKIFSKVTRMIRQPNHSLRYYTKRMNL